nr:disease resistance protein RPP13-like [Ipomoea batatas]
MDIDANPESLVSFVTEESKERPFSVVYGPEGLGKTTVVQNVYNKPEVRHQFTGCAWITLTHHLQRKTLWKDILSQIHYRKDDELNKLTDQDLYLKLHSALRDVHDKYLIVLDGICSMEGWEALLEAMPADKMLSKVVITTRNIEDTKRIIGEENGHFLQMRPLTEDQSWQFLKTQLLSHPSGLGCKGSRWHSQRDYQRDFSESLTWSSTSRREDNRECWRDCQCDPRDLRLDLAPHNGPHSVRSIVSARPRFHIFLTRKQE